MRIAVFGSGGVGGYFGGRLAQAGEEVVFIARGAHLAALRGRGLRVSSTAGDFSVHPVSATDDPSAPGQVDVVLLAVKAWQVPEAARAMGPLVGTETFVVPLQNGVEAPEELSAVLGARPVLGGVCRILASVAGPGEIRHAGVEPYVAFGELDGSRGGRAESLLRAFERTAGVTAEIPPDIRAAMWSKFLFITPLSGVAALTRGRGGTLGVIRETRQLLGDALGEVAALAAALGVALPENAADQTLSYIDSLPPDGTTSMQRDVMEGRPSELEAQVGAVVRLAEGAGVTAPAHRFMYAMLLPQERRARGEGG